MKTTRLTFFSLVAMIAIGLSLSSCKKDNTKTSLNQSDLISQSASDDQNVQDAQQAINDDVTNYMSGKTMKKGSGMDTVPCGIEINGAPDVANKIYHIKYSGTSCDNKRYKTGTIDVQLISGTQWKDVGAKILITYNVSVTKKLSGKIYFLKGVDTITNVSGGLLWPDMIVSGVTITHKVHGNDIITFPDGTVRTWQHYVQRQWQNTGGIYSLTVTGLGMADGFQNLFNWGINRRGNNFYTQITTDIVASGSCGYIPTGQITHTVVSSSTSESAVVMITLGVNALGNVVSGTCPDHYKINWQASNGKTGILILPYYL